MKFKITKPILQVLGLGVLAGMRTCSAPAITSHILSHHNSGHLAKSMLDFMQSKSVAIALKVLAIGELVADKLPSTPNRIKPAGIVCRSFAGALAGASIYKASGNNAFYGTVLGAATAIASTFGSYYLRKGTANKLQIFDPIIGAIEDILVIGAGVGLAGTA